MTPGTQANGREPIVVGLVNNMPDSALQATERQFRDLLAAASANRALQLRVFSFPDLVRADAAKQYVREHYEDIGMLWDARVDGLIVTGTEPRAPTLSGESYWPSLTRLIDWAEDHTKSTVWSCLAAHAAVLHLDGVERRPFATKLSGVFECAKSSDDAILAGMPAEWRVPHSRHNTLAARPLVDAGYDILSSSMAIGVDMFARRGHSLFLFLQGHPEYDAGALLREYQRDITRYLSGKSERYPDMPSGYFSDDVSAAFCAVRQAAMRDRNAEALSALPNAVTEPAQPWRDPGVRLYSNWLSHLE